MTERDGLHTLTSQMIILHDFGINVKEYFQLGKENEFPLIPCQRCKRFDHLKKNGFYWRYVVGPDTDGKSWRIYIRVLYCKLCRKVTSILPSFCVPYKTHTVLTFEYFFCHLFFSKLSLAEVVTRARKQSGYYQLAQAWIKSFKGNIPNLTAEVRSLLLEDCLREDTSLPPQRFQDLYPTWQILQRLARCLLLKSSLKEIQYFLWQKKKLGLFAYLG